MLEQFLIGFLNITAFKIVSIISRSVFANTSDQITIRVDKLTAQAVDRFQSKHGEKYGRGSFLDRESNWKLIAESLRQDRPTLSSSDFDLQGFNGAQPASIEDVEELIQILKEEFNSDIFIGTLLSVKDISRESKKTRQEVKELLDLLSGTEALLHKQPINPIDENGKLNIRYEQNEQIEDEFTEGKIYTRNLTDDVKMSFMLSGDVLYSEIQLHDGATTYYEVSKSSGVTIRKTPYPNMKIVVPEKFVIEKRWDRSDSGEKQFIIEGKWGLEVVWTFLNPENDKTNVNMKNASLKIVATKKEIVVTPKSYTLKT